MKIHKTDKERIYFIMDSGACGSIKREDIRKLCLVNTWLEEKNQVDPRTKHCLSEAAECVAALELEEIREELYNETFA